MALGGTLGIRPQGQTTVVTLTSTSTGAVYTGALVNGSSISFPYTLSADTDIYVPKHDLYTVSVVINGMETYGKVVGFNGGNHQSLQPTVLNAQQAVFTTAFLPQSATAVAITTAGTIPTTNGLQRVAPAGAVTGMLLAAGTYQGQNFAIVNESAFSVTFAASGTSKVADGTSDVIAASTARLFIWDTGTALWYRAG